MTVRQLVGDCRVTLPTLEAGTVQAAITSPPYYALRDYGTPPLVWGEKQRCPGIDINGQHDWGEEWRAPWANELPSAKSVTVRNNAYHESMGKTAGQSCHCGAWLGSLGLEPTPDLYIDHIVECFRHVRRVLRDDGVLWLNLGDSYAGSGKWPSNSLNRSNPHSHDAAEAMKRGLNNLRDTPTQWMPLQQIGPQEHTIGHGRVPGLKPKDLMLMPFRAAMALQADGWWVRVLLPWLKKNCMPSSEKDRPTVSVEYVFLLSKSRRYYWDYEAARRNGQPWFTKRRDGWDSSAGAHGSIHRNGREKGTNTGDTREGRNWRSGDMFFDSWQGMLVDDEGDPLALVVNPQPFSGAVQTSRRVPVALDAIDGDTKRTTSPTCAIHAFEDQARSNDQGDGRGGASEGSRRNPGTGNHHVQALLSDSAPTLLTHDADSLGQILDSTGLPCFDSAIDRSSEIHRTDLAPATSQPCTPSAQTADRTPRTSRSRAVSDWADRTSESSTGPADSADLLLSQTSGRTAGTPSIRASSSACSCSYYKDYTEKTSHFATFPPKLVEPMVKASTRPGDLILDPFSGAGSTLLVANRLGRNAIGCELKDEYSTMSFDRLRDDGPLFFDGMVSGVEARVSPAGESFEVGG